MSTKTAPILDQTHALIVNKQLEMKKKHRMTMRISDIIDVIITKNIHKLERYMGINMEQENRDITVEKETDIVCSECDSKQMSSCILSQKDGKENI